VKMVSGQGKCEKPGIEGKWEIEEKLRNERK
jgi:hypothetical protein